jgi:hypothetical protein
MHLFFTDTDVLRVWSRLRRWRASRRLEARRGRVRVAVADDRRTDTYTDELCSRWTGASRSAWRS